MNRFRTPLAAICLGLLMCATSCSDGEGAGEPSPTPSVSTPETTTPEEAVSEDASSDEGADPGSPTAGEIDYVRPAEADDECGVLEGLLELNRQAATQSGEASLAQLGDRLVLIEESAAQLAEYTDDESSRDQLTTMSQKYGEAAKFLESSGGQIQNDAFLALLGEAVTASNDAYTELEPYAAETCGVSLAPLVGEQ